MSNSEPVGSNVNLRWLQSRSTSLLHSRLCIMAADDGKAYEVRCTVSLYVSLPSSYAMVHGPPNAAQDIRCARHHCNAAATRYACTPFCISNLA